MFIDDIKIMAPQKSKIFKYIKVKLAVAFSIVDISLISFFLGLKVEWDQIKDTIKLLHPAYIDKIFSRFYFD